MLTIEELFTRVEDGIDAHPRFERVRLGSLVHDPVMEVRRSGFSIRILAIFGRRLGNL